MNKWKLYKAAQRENGKPATSQGYREWCKPEIVKPKKKYTRKPKVKQDIFEAVSEDYIDK